MAPRPKTALNSFSPCRLNDLRSRPAPGNGAADRLAVVELIGATTTKTGLKVESALDTRNYRKGIKVSKAEAISSMTCPDS